MMYLGASYTELFLESVYTLFKYIYMYIFIYTPNTVIKSYIKSQDVHEI